jgi:DNA-binding MarR family transcriptional regulator
MAKSKSGGIAMLERSPSHLLHKALQRALDIYAEEFGAAGITQRQFAVLAAAAERDGATQADLVNITGIDRSTLADMATRMIAKGLLARERSTADARANTVRLTDAGRDALVEAGPKMLAADTRVLKLISGGGRRETFVDLLRELVRKGEAGPVDKTPKIKKAKVEKAPKPPKVAKADKPPKAEKPPKTDRPKLKKPKKVLV